MSQQKAAENIVRHTNAVYVPEHNYALVDAREFKHLDLAFYNRTQRFLESRGFSLLCDKEDLTISNAPSSVLHRLFLRVMTSADGNICAAIYHPRIKSFWLRWLLYFLGKRVDRVVEFETEFADGSFLSTSSAMSAGAMSRPRQIDAEHFPYNTSAETLLQRHLSKLEQRLKVPGTTCRPVRTFDDNIAMQNRMNALKAAFRKKLGGVTKEELDKISPGSKELNADIHRKIEKINEQSEERGGNESA